MTAPSYHNFAQNISIVIPTLSRTDFILSNIAALDAAGFGGTLIVADSNPTAEFSHAAKSIREYNASFTVRHLHTPGDKVFEATSKALALVETPFMVWCGDDDFLVPETLQKCADFLLAHPDYSTVTGINIALDIVNGEITNTTQYMIYPVEHARPAERILELFNNYSVVHLALVRTEAFRACVAPQAPSLENRFLSAEIMWNTVLVILGKVGRVEDLLLVRSIHDRRMVYDSVLRQITANTWGPSARGYIAYASDMLEAHDTIDREKAERVVNAGYSAYLALHLRKESNKARSAAATTTSPAADQRPKAGFVELIKKIPIAGNVIRNCHAMARRHSERPLLTLRELRNPKSPFHRHFMPVFRTIVARERNH